VGRHHRWSLRYGQRVRIVVAVDGRPWVLRRSIVWRSDHADHHFELDAQSGGTEFIVTGLVLFWCLLIYIFIHNRPHVPGYFWVIIAVIAAFFAVVWMLTRWWDMVAETTNPVERWYGRTRGRANARDELRVIERSIRTHGSPAREGGRLTPVHTTPILNWPTPEEKT